MNIKVRNCEKERKEKKIYFKGQPPHQKFLYNIIIKLRNFYYIIIKLKRLKKASSEKYFE